MIPTRSRLVSWSPESLRGSTPRLAAESSAVSSAAAAIGLQCRNLPEIRAWEGIAQESAMEAFERARRRAASVEDLGAALASAIEQASYEISATRDAALGLAAELEAEDFLVSDQWVVTLKPFEMSPERARELVSARNSHQSYLNMKLRAVGDADHAAAEAINAAASAHGHANPFAADGDGAFFPSTAEPQSDIPQFEVIFGEDYQQTAQEFDAATTVAGVAIGENSQGEPTRTLRMQDGRTTVFTESESASRRPMQVMEEFTPSGEFLSKTTVFTGKDGQQNTGVEYADKTRVDQSNGPDGRITSLRVSPQGKGSQSIPLDSDLFENWRSTAAASALAGAAHYADDAAKMATSTLERYQLENFKSGAKLMGPGVTVAIALYDMFSADSSQEFCHATVTSAFSAAGGVGLGAVGSFFLGPLGTSAGSLAGSVGLGLLGQIIGEKVCY